MSRSFWSYAGAAVAAYFGYYNVAASLLAGGVQSEKQRRIRNQARDAHNASLQDRMVMLDLQPDAPRTLAMGRVRAVEGVRRRWVSGTNNTTLTLIVSFAGHEIDAFETFWFNDVPLTLDGSGWVQTEPYLKGQVLSAHTSLYLDAAGAATVTLSSAPLPDTLRAVATVGVGEAASESVVTITGSGVSYTLSGGPPLAECNITWQTSSGISQARIRPYLGTDAQNVGADLAAQYPGKITATDRFAGIALAVVDLLYDPDVFPQGVVNITATFRGAKLLDPRTSTTAWSRNPALQAYHYARWANGWAVPVGEVRAADVSAAADFCDTSTVFTLGVTPVTLARYTSDIVIGSDADPRGAMGDIMETMAGKWGWAGGTLRMRCGRMATPVFTLDASWLAQRLNAQGQAEQQSVVRITNGVPRDNKVNRVTGKCVDPAQRYQILPFPLVQDAALIAAEGQEYPLDVDLAGVAHIAHAQHLASIIIREQQAALRMDALCTLDAYRCEIFDVGSATLPRYGMAGKTLEVTGWRWHPTEGVNLKLAEITADIYDVVGALTGRDPAPNGDLPSPWDVGQVTGVAVTSGTVELTDASIITRTRVTWTSVPNQAVLVGGGIEVQYTLAAEALPSADWPSHREPGSATSTTLPSLLAGRHYLFRVRAINGLGVRGPWSAQVLHLVADVPLVDADGLYVEYSIDGATAWHTTYTAGDLFARWKTGVAGAWQGPFRIVGEDGSAGDYVDFVFKRAATIPATPTGNTPVGWSDAPPAADGNPLWASTGTKTAAGVLVGVWALPVQIEGAAGQDGAAVTAYSNDGPVFVATASGTSWTPATITLRRFLSVGLSGGTTSWSVVSGTFTGSLSMLSETDGRMSALDPGDMTTDTVTFRCTYTVGADAYTDDITVSKSRDGYGAYLTNEHVNLPASNAGAISSYSGATGTLKVTKAGTDVGTAALAFAITGHSGFGTTYPTNTGISINSSGVYTVSSNIPNGTDLATVTFRATYTDPLGGTKTFDRVFSIGKSKTGADGAAGGDGSDGARGSLTLYSSSVSPAVNLSGTTWPLDTTSPFGTNDNNALKIVWQALGNSAGSFVSNTVSHMRIGDTVTLTNAAGDVSIQKYWTGSYWADPGVVISGNLLVGGTISGELNLNITGSASFEGVNSSISIEDPFNSPSNFSRTVAAISNTSGGAQIGLYASSATAGSFGVYGYNSATTGDTAGVLGHGLVGVAGVALPSVADALGMYAQGGTTASSHGLLAQRGTSGSSYAIIAEGNLLGPGNAIDCRGYMRISGQLDSTVATGTAPIAVDSATVCPNLNASLLLGKAWAAPDPIGATTPSTGRFSSLRIDQTPATGAAVATFSGVKPGAATTNTWFTVSLNGTTYYLPAWL